MFKTSKAPVTSGLRPGYDLPATVKCENRGQVVETTYGGSHTPGKSWPGDRQGKMSCNKVDGQVKNLLPAIPNRKRSQIGLTWSYHKSCMVTPTVVVDDRGSEVARLIVRSIARCYDWSYDRSFGATIDRTIGRRWQRSVARCYDWSCD